MAKVAVKRLSGSFGCEVENIDLRFPGDYGYDTIEHALNEHMVVILPRQSIGPKGFLALAQFFGKPAPHGRDQFQHKMAPDIVIVSNRRDDKGAPVGLADDGTYFHTANAHQPVPARCTLLFAQEMAAGEVATLANQRQAWEDLPAETKTRLAPLVVRHHDGDRDALDATSRAAVAMTRHPLVRQHAHINRKSLYAVAGSSFGIEGMGDNEGRALLDDLKTHATQDKYCIAPTCKPGDVVIWDNCSLLHKAPLVATDTPRTLWRITVADAGPTIAA